MLVVNSLCKNIFLIFFSKFPVFSLSGKMDFQIPCFPCAMATLFSSYYMIRSPPRYSHCPSHFYPTLYNMLPIRYSSCSRHFYPTLYNMLPIKYSPCSRHFYPTLYNMLPIRYSVPDISIPHCIICSPSGTHPVPDISIPHCIICSPSPPPGTHPAPNISRGVRQTALAYCTCARSVRSGALQVVASVE